MYVFSTRYIHCTSITYRVYIHTKGRNYMFLSLGKTARQEPMTPLLETVPKKSHACCADALAAANPLVPAG